MTSLSPLGSQAPASGQERLCLPFYITEIIFIFHGRHAEMLENSWTSDLHIWHVIFLHSMESFHTHTHTHCTLNYMHWREERVAYLSLIPPTHVPGTVLGTHHALCVTSTCRGDLNGDESPVGWHSEKPPHFLC